MRIILLGLNHRTAPVEMREKLAASPEELDAALAKLRQRYPQAECVLLATCNRVELYVARAAHEPPSVDDLRQFLAEHGDIDVRELLPATIHREQEQAIRHLFRVCSGLDSMVLGEPQILGQVKRSYEAAVARETVGPTLHRLFQQAIAAAKHVRHVTGIDSGRVSVGSVAVDFARQVFEDFSDKTVVGIGAGEMAKVALRHLLQVSPGKLWLTNRSPQKAIALAQSLDLTGDKGGPRAWDEMEELLVEADVVMTSTASREPIISTDQLKRLQKRRRHRPLFIIDLAVPRDVEPGAGAINNVYLYNIDDLQSVIAGNVDERREQAQQCEAHLDEAVASCLRQLQHRDVGQLVRQLRNRLHAIGETEQQRSYRKLLNVAGQANAEELDQLLAEHTQRVINKILHLPLSQLDEREVGAPLGFYAAALRRLFDLDGGQGAEVPRDQEAEESRDQGVEVPGGQVL